MNTIKPKSHCNFYCKVVGLLDRLFKQIRLDTNSSIYYSGFLTRLRKYAVQYTGELLVSSQSKINQYRSSAELIIGELTAIDLESITHKPETIQDKRNLQSVKIRFKELVEIHNHLKAELVTVEAKLDEYSSDVKRQATAYLISAVSIKQELDIDINTSIDYRGTTAYATYISTYNYVDNNICAVVDRVVKAEELIKNLEEVLAYETA